MGKKNRDQGIIISNISDNCPLTLFISEDRLNHDKLGQHGGEQVARVH